jgi:K+-transporting ATPase ATPase B chain
MPRGPRDQRRYTERPKGQGLLGRAIIEAFRKLDPRLTVRNPVMFVVWCGTVVTLAATVEPQLFGLSSDDPGRGFNGALAAILVFTLLFANLAEALAEGRGKAQADALRRTQARTQARRLLPDGSEARVDSSSLRKGDQVQVSSGELIPADGEVVAGVAVGLGGGEEWWWWWWW